MVSEAAALAAEDGDSVVRVPRRIGCEHHLHVAGRRRQDDDERARAMFRILLVSGTAVSRTPMAERILQHAVDLKWGRAAGEWDVASAGLDISDQPSAIQPLAVRALAQRGINADDYVSRPLDDELLAGADLILTMERAQRSRVATLDPRTLGHLFTLLQLATLATSCRTLPAAAPMEQGRLLIREAALQRGLAAARFDKDDVAPPSPTSYRQFRRCGQQLTAAVDQILRPCGSEASTSR